MSRQQILVDTSGTLPLTITSNGTATDADGDVTYVVTDGAGATVASGTADKTGGATGEYTITLAAQTVEKTLSVAWTFDLNSVEQTLTTGAEIVGGFLFTETEARSFNQVGGQTNAPLNSATKYPDARIAEARAVVTDLLEQWTGVSWVPRWRRDTLPGTGGFVLELERPKIRSVVAATIGGTSLTVSDLTVHGQRVHRENGVWTVPTVSDPTNVVVDYVHGWSPTDRGDVKRVALLAAVEYLVPHLAGDFLTFDTGLGTQRLIQPGGPAGNVSKYAAINAWVAANSHRLPVF